MNTFKVLVVSGTFGKAARPVFERLRAAGCQLVPNPHDHVPNENEMMSLVRDVDIIVSGAEPITQNVLAAAQQLKGIAKHGAGCENIDLNAAKARNVPVCVAGDSSTNSVADMVFGLVLACARKIPQGDAAMKNGDWHSMVGSELAGKTLGIVGLGQTGKAVCRRAKGFEMSVIAHDVQTDKAFAKKWDVRYVEFAELLRSADFISLHTFGDTAASVRMDSKTLAQMKPSAYLINTARGEMIDEGALFVALRRGQLAGAACDVFEEEPPKHNPLLALDNFIATPGSAAHTIESLRAMDEATCDNVLRLLRDGGRSAPTGD